MKTPQQRTALVVSNLPEGSHPGEQAAGGGLQGAGQTDSNSCGSYTHEAQARATRNLTMGGLSLSSISFFLSLSLFFFCLIDGFSLPLS